MCVNVICKIVRTLRPSKLWSALVSANELSETSTIYEVLRGDFYIISQAIYAFG